VAKAAQAEHKSKFIDFQRRRSVHISLFTETHKELRKALVERSLSMQELFQRFSELVLSGDKRAVKILDDLEKDKRTGAISKPRTSVDKRSASVIYDIIAAESEIENQPKEEEDD
jgi:hypothetical protein